MNIKCAFFALHCAELTATGLRHCRHASGSDLPSSCYSSHPNLILHAVKRGDSTPPWNTGRLQRRRLMGEKQTLLRLMPSTRGNEPQVNGESVAVPRVEGRGNLLPPGNVVRLPACSERQTCTLCQQTDR